MSHKVTATGKSEGLVKHVLQISNERSRPINDFVQKAAENTSRSAEYIAETLSQVSEICESNEEVAYAGYVVGILMGATSELKEAMIGSTLRSN